MEGSDNLVGVEYQLKEITKEQAQNAPQMVRILYNFIVGARPVRKILADQMIDAARKKHPEYFEPVFKTRIWTK